MISLLPVSKTYLQTLLEVHWAAQIPAAASHKIEAKPDWSHTNLLVEDGVLRGRPMADARRVELDIPTLTLRCGASEFALQGHTLKHGMDWLSEQLGEAVDVLEHALPARPIDKAFSLYGAEPQLKAWFDLAQHHLSAVSASEGGGEVRLWPHHFDIATLIELDESGGEETRSINVGLSPGDSSYAEPYWYVTPWPTPSKALPTLHVGTWHTEGFTAAVFSASKHDEEHPEPQVSRFLQQAVAACRGIL